MDVIASRSVTAESTVVLSAALVTVMVAASTPLVMNRRPMDSDARRRFRMWVFPLGLKVLLTVTAKNPRKAGQAGEATDSFETPIGLTLFRSRLPEEA